MVLLTGVPSVGKTTIGSGVVQALTERGESAELLDGDELRARLPPGLGFSIADRVAQGERAAFIAELLASHGVLVVLALIAPLRRTRAMFRQRFEASGFTEVFLHAPLHVCVERDSRGAYQQTRARGDAEYADLLDVYERPRAPEIDVDTAETRPEESVELVLAAIDAARSGSR